MSSMRITLTCIAALALVVLSSIHGVTGFQFYLHSGERRCFTESVSPNTKVLGEYTVSTGEGNMVVDISVRIPEENHNLYHKRNIDHGKFAFVVPFADSHSRWKILASELHRKKMQQKIGEVFQHHSSEERRDNHHRRLLSSSYSDHTEKLHDQHAHERQSDEHGKARPPLGHGSGQESHMRNNAYKDVHEESHDHHVEDSEQHQHHYHSAYGDDLDDNIDDFDMDDYDGIDDDELDSEVAEQEAAHAMARGSAGRAFAADKEAELFESRKFEVCVSGDGEKGVYKRRVRLHIHKGETAHDYTRLAKKEHMSQLEISLRRVSQELYELMHELDKARRKEDSLRNINENTNRRVMMLAIVSLVSLAAVGSYQAVYTKRFLQRKKIL